MSQFELPTIECLEISDTHGIMATCEPHLPKGFGITLGNSLRRVLLNALPGVAVTWIKIEGIHHGFTTIPHVKEDIIELLLGVRSLRMCSLLDNWPVKMFLEVKGDKDGRLVTAADINAMNGLEIINPELHLAFLDSSEAQLSMEFNVEQGVGYRIASSEELPVDAIPVDAIFTPIRRVNYKIEAVHTSENLDCEKLVIEIWTDGTISPLDALKNSAQILTDCLSPFVSAEISLGEVETASLVTPISAEQYNISLDTLGLSGRIIRSLMRNHITMLGELLEKTDKELLKLPKFGQKSLKEVNECLSAGGFIPEQLDEAAGADEVQGEGVLPDKDDIPLESLGLSRRILALLREYISSVGELQGKTDEELLKLPKFGQKSLKEVKDCLVAGGFVSEDEQSLSSQSEDEELKDS